MNAELEAYRKETLLTIRREESFLKKLAEDTLGCKVLKIKPIGSVTSKARFTEESDVDVAFYCKKSESRIAGPQEDLSEKLQNELARYFIGDIGVINCLVFM